MSVDSGMAGGFGFCYLNVNFTLGWLAEKMALTLELRYWETGVPSSREVPLLIAGSVMRSVRTLSIERSFSKCKFSPSPTTPVSYWVPSLSHSLNFCERAGLHCGTDGLRVHPM